jgi:glutathione S-transferase
MSSLKLALGCAAGGVLGYVLTKLFDSPQQGKVKGGTLTIGYWKIRGLGAPLRMMCCYAGQPFVNKAYGDDAKTAWFGSEKKRLKDVNALINLPYVIEGPTAADPTETVVTQSNSCLIYLGQRLGIDRPELATHNHMALDQLMDLRNDTMKIVYPFANVVTKQADFKAGLKEHVAQTASMHLAKLEGHCVGPYLCGGEIQSADFHMFEMLDQHVAMCEQAGVVFDVSPFPKLKALHGALRADPALALYFASDMYKRYAFNNPMAAFFCGTGYGDGPFGVTLEEQVRTR